MNQKKVDILLLIASAGLIIAGMIFLLVAIFGEEKSNWVLISALSCIALSNLFAIIRTQLHKKSK